MPRPRRTLELVSSRGARDTSLLAALDRTVTPMGGRRLRTWILQPIRDLAELDRRQQFIADLLQEPDLLASLREGLKTIRDLERASGRLSQASGNARDLVALKVSLQQIPELKRELQKLLERLAFGANQPQETIATGLLAARVQKELHEMPELAARLSRALADDPPLALKEGGIFRDGFDPQLDELRQASRDGKIGSPNCRSGKSRALGSSRSKSASTPSSAISLRSRNRIWPARPPITRASKRPSAASASSRPSSRRWRRKFSAPTSGRDIWNINFSWPCAKRR